MSATTPPQSASPLVALRAEMTRRGLDGFVVPRSDRFLGEYVHESDERLNWLTGFDGSAGLAIVLAKDARLFVDGRYTLQAAQQVDDRGFSFGRIGQGGTGWAPGDWLAGQLPKQGKLGFDPWLHSATDAARLRAACARATAQLVACADNPIDAVWAARPPGPRAPITVHPDAYAGKDNTTKRAELSAALNHAGQDAVVLTAPDSVAWLFNIRGADVPFAPLPLAYAIVTASGTATLFSDSGTPSADVQRHLGPDVTIAPLAAFNDALTQLGATGAKIRVPEGSAPYAVGATLRDTNADIATGSDPCALPKARKNTVELSGARAAHHRDGVAVVRFLSWLADQSAAAAPVDELSGSDQLDRFRRDGANHRGPSFQTISGSGPNGAIVHYRVTEATSRTLGSGDIYLLDSGGQYLDGTTDITRTVLFGDLADDATGRWKRACFTRVLKGHIALATARFPSGTTGSQLDALARTALWQAGLDYDHGTGHGVGSYLSVHEGPHRISKAANTVALEPGMILSNEPGYYEQDAFGIRTENLMAVRPHENSLAFEILTLAPIDRNLIDATMLSPDECAWLDSYHQRVFATLSGDLTPQTKRWLDAATRPIAQV